MNKITPIILFFLLINYQPVSGQDYNFKQGTIIVDSIVNSKNIMNSNEYFNKNIDSLQHFFSKGFTNIVIKDLNLKEFVFVYSNMSQQDIIKDFHKNFCITGIEFRNLKHWYKRKKGKITLDMIKDFIRYIYAGLLSDEDQKQLEEKLIFDRCFLKKEK